MKEEPREEVNKIQKSTKILAEVVSRTLGPLIGEIDAGPVGAAAGGVAGTLLKFGLEEFMNRWLTPKEVKRVGTSGQYIIDEINRRLEKGESFNMALFETTPEKIADAEELFEGVLSKCKNEYQEKKLKYISNIFVSAAFDKSISAITANQILSVGERLTYRKLVVLAFYGRRGATYDMSTLMIEPYTWYTHKLFLQELEILKQDIFELVNLGLISTDNIAILTSDDIVPGKFSLTDVGEVYHRQLGLFSIDENETDLIYHELRYREELGISDEGTKNGVKVV